uniref:Uncharacterized protein n=1 Tax=Arundo donax TaxID=35708 RepID=A0A0A8YC35_ARUDO
MSSFCTISPLVGKDAYQYPIRQMGYLRAKQNRYVRINHFRLFLPSNPLIHCSTRCVVVNFTNLQLFVLL